jgi:hypothetical protein
MRLSICIFGLQAAIRPTLEPARWWRGHERDNLAALGFDQPWFASSTHPIPEAINTLGIKSVDPLSDCLRVTLEFGSNDSCTPAIPAPGDHLGAGDPVAGRMTAGHKFANYMLFRIVTRRTCL